jgi:hypothetical protein
MHPKYPAGTSWGFSKEVIEAIYKSITRPILLYVAPIWYPLAWRSIVADLQVVQNSTLRLATGCLKMTAIEHLHTKTGPLTAQLDLFHLSPPLLGKDPSWQAAFFSASLHPSWGKTHHGKQLSFPLVSAPTGERPILCKKLRLSDALLTSLIIR